MRIVVDATAAVAGGKIYLTQLLSEFARSQVGHEFIIFHLDDDELVALKIRGRFQFHRVALPGARHVNGLLVSLSKMLWRLMVLPWHLWRLQPDLLFSNAGFSPGWLPKKVRVVLALHNSLPFHERQVWAGASLWQRLRLMMQRHLMRRAVRKGDGVIVFSEHLRQRVLAECGMGRQTLTKIYCGVDWGETERMLAPDNAQLARYELRRPYLLYVSHLHHYKNVPRLLEAFALLVKEHPDLLLVLAGEAVDRRCWQQIQQMIKTLELSAAVKHLSHCSREELKTIYRGALAVVYPSLAENCPFGMLEALACGLPIAAADTSAMPEIGRDAAIYFNPHDAAQMAAVIDRLVRDQSLRTEMSWRAVARAQQFSWPLAAQETLRIFARVVEHAKTKE